MRTRNYIAIAAICSALLAGALVSTVDARNWQDFRRSVANLLVGDLLVATSGTVLPQTDDNVDLGSASAQFKDLYIDGTANIDALATGGSLTLENGEIIGNAVDAAVTVTYDDDAPELSDTQILSSNVSTEDNNYHRLSFWMLDDSVVAGQAQYDMAHIEFTGTDITSTTLDSDISFAVVTNANATAAVEVAHIDGAAIFPETDNGLDLGKAGTEWKDLYIDGTAIVDSLNATEVILVKTAVSLTSPTVTIAIGGAVWIELNSDANQTGATFTGGTVGQHFYVAAGSGSNTVRFDDDGVNMALGANKTLTEGTGGVLEFLCVASDDYSLVSDQTGN